MSYTLTTLKSAIQDYTENTETTFVSHLRDFIRSTENRLFKMIDFEYFRKNVTSATTSSDRFLSFPDDYIRTQRHKWVKVTADNHKSELMFSVWNDKPGD